MGGKSSKYKKKYVRTDPILVKKNSFTKTSNTDILVVDDSEINRIILKGYIEKFKFKVDHVSDGNIAIYNVSIKKYGIIFMDIRMPVMNGIEATREIRKIDDKVIIIGVTGDVDIITKNKCYSAGMNNILAKPVRLDDIALILNDYTIYSPRNI